MKTRICEKCGGIMEELKVDSPTNMKGFRCPNTKCHEVNPHFAHEE